MKARTAVASLVLMLTGLSSSLAGAAAPAGHALLLDLDGPVSPASSHYIVKGIHQAATENDQLVILRMDTPGGLDTSMREIIKAILASPVPVVGFVAPGGSRAASAGTYIMYACHVAAMAPGTNLGAATPVQIMGNEKPWKMPDDNSGKAGKDEPATAEGRKVLNDAIAYITSLAEKHGRNAQWATQAVREASSLPADEALKKNVIDLMAPDLPGLLTALDGRKVTTAAGTVTLHTAGMQISKMKPDWRTDMLGVLTNPTVAYVLMLIGIYGLVFEGYNPGAILPGVAGAICLLLALFAFQILPVNFAGFALILLGVALMIAEAFVPSFGTLGIGGVAAFVIGSIILMDMDVPGFGVPHAAIAAVGTVGAGAILMIVVMARRAWRRPTVTGQQELIGKHAVAIEDFLGQGRVKIMGELWNARATGPVRAGEEVIVVAVDGLLLTVRPRDATNGKEG